jgi:hypothetical protein
VSKYRDELSRNSRDGDILGLLLFFFFSSLLFSSSWLSKGFLFFSVYQVSSKSDDDLPLIVVMMLRAAGEVGSFSSLGFAKQVCLRDCCQAKPAAKLDSFGGTSNGDDGQRSGEW